MKGRSFKSGFEIREKNCRDGNLEFLYCPIYLTGLESKLNYFSYGK